MNCFEEVFVCVFKAQGCFLTRMKVRFVFPKPTFANPAKTRCQFEHKKRIIDSDRIFYLNPYSRMKTSKVSL